MKSSLFLLLPISITFFSNNDNNYCTSDVILQSPIVTNWGQWGDWEFCPNNTYVVAMELQSDRYSASSSSSSDLVGLSGVKLYCSEPTTVNGTTIISSSNLNNNNVDYYGSKFYCSNVAIGFQLRSETNQGSNDDTAANNLRLYCSGTPEESIETSMDKKYLLLEGDGSSNGQWTTPQLCFKRQAICGLQTMIEPWLGSSGDDTGLNNLRIKCCDLPDPALSCIPTDDWDLLVECDNRLGLGPMSCSYEKKIGLSYTETSSETMNEEISYYKSLDFNIGSSSGGLAMNFKINLGTSSITGYKWDSSSTNEWHSETKTSVSFEVSPGIRAELYQTLGQCGIYSIRPVRFRRIDTKYIHPAPNNYNYNSTNNFVIYENISI